jgi:hypothetical protein
MGKRSQGSQVNPPPPSLPPSSAAGRVVFKPVSRKWSSSCRVLPPPRPSWTLKSLLLPEKKEFCVNLSLLEENNGGGEMHPHPPPAPFLKLTLGGIQKTPLHILHNSFRQEPSNHNHTQRTSLWWCYYKHNIPILVFVCLFVSHEELGQLFFCCFWRRDSLTTKMGK